MRFRLLPGAWCVAVLVAASPLGVRPAAAQLCTWGGSPSLPPPSVEFLRSQAEHVRAPGRVAVNAELELYATDPTTGRVVVSDLYGRVIDVREGMGVPLAIAVDAFDNIYVGEQSTGRVTVFDSHWQETGVLGQGDGEFVAPTDIAIDPDPAFGRIYVADGGAHIIKIYSLDGALIDVFGSSGTGPGEFDFPSAVWVSQTGEVFVGDQNNDRIQVLDREGNFIRCYGDQGGAQRNFGRIQGLAGDDVGRLYVVDSFQGYVQVFDAQGAVVSTIGSLGDRPGQVRTPVGLVIDGFNRLFVSSMNSGSLEVFGLDDFVDPPPDDQIFSDGFESGDTGVWSDATR